MSLAEFCQWLENSDVGSTSSLILWTGIIVMGRTMAYTSCYQRQDMNVLVPLFRWLDESVGVGLAKRGIAF